MDKSSRINAILDYRNFDFALPRVFGHCFDRKSSVSKETISRIVFKNNRARYSEDECRLFAEGDFRVSSLRKELSEACKPIFRVSGRDLSIESSHYVLWKKMLTANGQDVFVAATFGDALGIKWPYCIPINMNALDVGLRSKYAENHCHFSAAGPVFSFNWVFLHNGSTVETTRSLLLKCQKQFTKYYDEDKFWTFYNLALLSIYLRRVLYVNYAQHRAICPFSVSLGIRFTDLRRRMRSFERGLIDSTQKLGRPFAKEHPYPIQDYANKLVTDNPIYGERRFLCECFNAFEKSSPIFQNCFYLYLLCRRYIFGFFNQNNMWYGFSNFKRFERFGDLFLPNRLDIKRFVAKVTYEALCQDKDLSAIEIRTAPKSTAVALRERVASIDPRTLSARLQSPRIQASSISSPRFGLVLHFIKESRHLASNKKKGPITSPRFMSQLEGYQKQTNAIKNFFLGQNVKNQFPLVGIDAANEELNCRPEVFAPYYRELRHFHGIDRLGQTRYSNLKFTFHCGEDFLTLASGLRAIYEAVNYLELSDGDRIGHASALGTDVDKYFMLKGYNTIQTKQDCLDDYCFLYYVNRTYEGDLSVVRFLQDEIQKLLLFIYQSDNVDSYIRSLSLRCDSPWIYKEVHRPDEFVKIVSRLSRTGKRYEMKATKSDQYGAAWDDQNALRFIHQYHYSAQVRSKGDESIGVYMIPCHLLAIKNAQRALVDIIRTKGIGIETNPTSNFLIGPFDDFNDIPTFNLIGANEKARFYKGLLVTLGTDDPGLFSASLRNEYGSIAYTLQRLPDFNEESLIKWIKKLAESSRDLSFVP